MSSIVDLCSLSLYKTKSDSISSFSNQNERRREVLARQKEKRDTIVSQFRFSSVDNQSIEAAKCDWPPRRQRRNVPSTAPIEMMLAEWLFCPPKDISSWFIIPCPRGQRCLVVVQSHRTQIYTKYGNLIRTMLTQLPRETILYCIYDHRSSIYSIIDIIMWNGQDYSTQIECQCRFFMLLSLNGDLRLTRHFQILPRIQIEDKQEFPLAEDGYLFYHPDGFYESGYSPLVCWLKPFMIEEILSIKLSYPIEKPRDYTTAQDYMFKEQTNRKEQQSVDKSHKNKGNHENHLMSID